MRTFWIVLTGIVAAVAYGLASHAIAGTWNFSLAFVVGAVLALALSGFRARPEDASTSSHLQPSTSNLPTPPAPIRPSTSDLPPPASNLPPPPSDLQPSTFNLPPSPSNLQPSTFNLQPLPSPLQPPVDVATLWKQAREMVHNVIPDPEEDADYLDLVFTAAERGHVPALAKLGDYAFRRADFVEAYFWTTMAKRRLELSSDADPQQLKEIAAMLRNIRREWAAAGHPPELENVYANFPEERGELGRAFLRLDGGVEVKQTRDYIRCLAEKGNPDAALFVDEACS